MKRSEILSVFAPFGGTSKHLVISLVRRRMRWIVFLPLLSTAVANAAICPNMRSFRNAALLLGISNPWLQEGPRPLRFAGADAASLQPLFEQQFGSENVFALKDREATTANVYACLDAIARFAQPGSKVVIFISARGFASSQTDDGYVLTYDAAIDKLPRAGGQQVGNGIAIQTLRRKMAAMQAREKYLLLDLCRDPAETTNLDNLINKRVLEKRFLDAATRQIVLASTGSQRSFESTEPKNGHGYYASALIEILKPGVGLQKLFDDLKARVKEKSQMKQAPYRPSPAPNDRNGCLLCKLSRSRIAGPLFASLAPVSFFQDAPPTPSAADLRALTEAAKDEEEGQRIFVRYGEGNHFSGDPFHQCEHPKTEFRSFRLCREEYEAAARKFDRAAALREMIPTPDPDGNQMLIESLKERARFCRAQVLLLAKDWAGVVVELGNLANSQFAESHNILGIAYLEQAKFAEAEAQFQMAIRQAPHWAYPRHNLALAYVEHGNYSAAEREYREAIRWTPVGDKTAAEKNNPCFHGRRVTVSARPYLYYNLGVLLQRLNRLTEAQQQYCLAEQSFLLQLGLLDPRGLESDADQAELANLRSIAAKINLADVNNSLGALFEARSKRGRARAQFQKALSNNPELSAASFNLARLDADQALTKGDTGRARQRYQEVLDQPSCQGAPNELGCRAAQTALDRLPLAAPK
jgi:Tfp pilus assembly protein PilF